MCNCSGVLASVWNTISLAGRGACGLSAGGQRVCLPEPSLQPAGSARRQKCQDCSMPPVSRTGPRICRARGKIKMGDPSFTNYQEFQDNDSRTLNQVWGDPSTNQPPTGPPSCLLHSKDGRLPSSAAGEKWVLLSNAFPPPTPSGPARASTVSFFVRFVTNTWIPSEFMGKAFVLCALPLA